jgi:hypothetical protein
MTALEANTDLPTLNDFEHWLKTSQPKNSIIYAERAWLDENHRAAVKIIPDQTRAVARAAWRAYEAGLCRLVHGEHLGGEQLANHLVLFDSRITIAERRRGNNGHSTSIDIF